MCLHIHTVNFATRESQRSILTSNNYIALLARELHEASCFFYWYTRVCDKRTISVEYMKKNVVFQN